MKKKYSWTPGDLIIPILAIILAVYYLITIRGIPRMAQMYGGILSIGVIILSIIIGVLAVKSGVFNKERWKFSFLHKYKKAAILTVFIALYIFIIPYLGYPLTSIIFMCVVMYFLNMKNIPKIISISVIVTLLGFCLFILFLNVSLPLDPLTEKIKYFVRQF